MSGEMFERGQCEWLVDEWCLNCDEFITPEKVNGGYCSCCDRWEEEKDGELLGA